MKHNPRRLVIRALALAGTLSALAKACSISRQTLYSLLTGKSGTLSSRVKLENFIETEESRRGPRGKRSNKKVVRPSREAIS